jgi:hypothetical protein
MSEHDVPVEKFSLTEDRLHPDLRKQVTVAVTSGHRLTGTLTDASDEHLQLEDTEYGSSGTPGLEWATHTRITVPLRAVTYWQVVDTESVTDRELVEALSDPARKRAIDALAQQFVDADANVPGKRMQNEATYQHRAWRHLVEEGLLAEG